LETGRSFEDPTSSALIIGILSSGGVKRPLETLRHPLVLALPLRSSLARSSPPAQRESREERKMRERERGGGREDESEGNQRGGRARVEFASACTPSACCLSRHTRAGARRRTIVSAALKFRPRRQSRARASYPSAATTPTTTGERQYSWHSGAHVRTLRYHPHPPPLSLSLSFLFKHARYRYER